MKKIIFSIASILVFSQHSFARNCDAQAISRALIEHQKSGLVDPYLLSHYEVVGRTVENSSLYTVVRFIDSNYSTFYTVEQNPLNCKIRSIE